MDTKTLIKALKSAVREVIKEELTEILRDGLQSTINEMKSTSHIGKQRSVSKPIPEPAPVTMAVKPAKSLLITLLPIYRLFISFYVVGNFTDTFDTGLKNITGL